MEDYGEITAIDFDKYPRTEAFTQKRVGAYVIDLAFSMLIVLLVQYIVRRPDFKDPYDFLFLIAGTALLITVYKFVTEMAFGRTIGKYLFKLRVVGPRDEIDISSLLIRNLTNLVLILGPFADMLIGGNVSRDDRQKATDHASTTLVVEDDVEVVEVIRRPVYRPIERPEPKPKEKYRLDYRNFMRGNCPRCGSPYRILPPDDDSWAGLWNHRCTWCNYLIPEEEIGK